MGWETLAIAGFSALSASNTIEGGESSAKAAVAEGQIQAQNSANNTVRTASKLQTSFLQSGLTLEGGPMQVISSAFASGQRDLGQIVTNANYTAKNDINAARSKAIQGLISTAALAGGSSFLNGIGDFADDVGSGLDSVSNGTSFSLGFDASSDFRAAGGGFAPGEFK